MFCNKCELRHYREKSHIPKRHCKKCMSSFYMKQAEDYIQNQIYKLKQQELSPKEVKAINYNEVRKVVDKEVKVFTKRKKYIAENILKSSVAKEIIKMPNIIKINRVIEDELDIISLPEIYCTVKNRKNGNLYFTSLDNCTCKDYEIHKRPCKHMYRLAMAIGLIDPPNKVIKK